MMYVLVHVSVDNVVINLVLSFYYEWWIIMNQLLLSFLMFDMSCGDKSGCKRIENRSAIQSFNCCSSDVLIKNFLR